jgi:capsular polysaccharide biosynthesis protein
MPAHLPKLSERILHGILTGYKMNKPEILIPFETEKDIKEVKDINSLIKAKGNVTCKYLEDKTNDKNNNFYYGGNFKHLPEIIKDKFTSPHKTPSVYISKYANCTLIDDSLVISSDNKISKECILNRRYFHQKSVKLNARGIEAIHKEPKETIKIDKTCIFAPANGLITAYTHWFTEIITRLAILKNLPNEDIYFIFDDNILGYQKEMLQKLGIDENKIILKNKNNKYIVKELYLPGGFANIWLSEGCFYIYDKLKQGLNLNNVREEFKSGFNKIYLSRKDDKWKRSLLNLTQIHAPLQKAGYKAVIPESLNLDEKIYLFSNATHIVGEAGGGMTNIVFSNPGTKILVLASESFPSPIFTNICTEKNIKYGYVMGTSYEFGDAHDNNANFVISEKEFKAGLNALEAA